MASPGKVLIIVQNLPVPFDRRVWLEATTLEKAGYRVSVICPTGKHGKYQTRQEILEGVYIFRYAASPEANSTIGYFFEFAYSWLATAWNNKYQSIGRANTILLKIEEADLPTIVSITKEW